MPQVYWPAIMRVGHSLLLAAEESSGGILSFDKALLAGIGIQLFNVLLLTVVMVKLLYKPVLGFMAARTERIRNEIEAARAERDEALELKEKYEKFIDEIEQEREEILLQAHKKAMERSDQLLFDARHEAEAMYNRALADLDVERENVMDEMKKQMIEISLTVAGRFVEVSIDRETQNRYIEEAFADWEGS